MPQQRLLHCPGPSIDLKLAPGASRGRCHAQAGAERRMPARRVAGMARSLAAAPPIGSRLIASFPQELELQQRGPSPAARPPLHRSASDARGRPSLASDSLAEQLGSMATPAGAWRSKTAAQARAAAQQQPPPAPKPAASKPAAKPAVEAVAGGQAVDERMLFVASVLIGYTVRVEVRRSRLGRTPAGAGARALDGCCRRRRPPRCAASDRRSPPPRSRAAGQVGRGVGGHLPRAAPRRLRL